MTLDQIISKIRRFSDLEDGWYDKTEGWHAGPVGQAPSQLKDRDGKQRILAGTFPDGNAVIQLDDRDGKERIVAGTLSDGNAVIQL